MTTFQRALPIRITYRPPYALMPLQVCIAAISLPGEESQLRSSTFSVPCNVCAARWEEGVEEPTLADVGAPALIRILEKKIPEIEPAACFYLSTLAEDEDAFALLSTSHAIELLLGVIHEEREVAMERSATELDFEVNQKVSEQTGGLPMALSILNALPHIPSPL